MRLRLFCLLLAALPVAAFAGAIAIAKSHWFITQAVPPYLKMLDDESTVRGRQCEVLIFGDSTALTGYQPWTIQSLTGMRTCNVAQTKGTIGVSGVQTLRDYLARNPAPRLLAIAFSPEDWRPIRNWGETAYVEGVLQLVRHQPLRVYGAALAQHPNEAFGFATFVYKSAIAAVATHGRSAQWPTSGIVGQGHMTLPSSAETACLGDDAHSPLDVVTPSPEYAVQLRREFTTTQTQVILLSPPIPDCDPLLGFFAARLNGVLSAPITTLPIGDYNDVDRHFTAQGSEIYSTQIAALLRTRLAALR